MRNVERIHAYTLTVAPVFRSVRANVELDHATQVEFSPDNK